MSKHKTALPERLYYRLADAANLLGCTADDLLHYGACGYLEICASADDLFVQGVDFDELAGEDNGDGKGGIVSFPDSRVFRWLDFFALSTRQVGGIETRSECKCTTSRAIYRLAGGELLPVDLKGSTVQAGTVVIEDGEFFSDYFELCASPPVNGWLSGEPIKVTASDLWVRAEELRRFQKEGSSHVRHDPPMSDIQEKPIGITERNKTLAIIAALADKCGIDVTARGAAAEIARLTESFGAVVSPDSVGRRLKEIPEALESFNT